MDYNEYFKKMGCDYWYEYDLAYSRLNVRDRTITIVGNDCGSSALYFIMNGAKHIIGFEKKAELNNIFKNHVCKDFGICNMVETNKGWAGNVYPNTDLFVIDCEGCEEYLEIEELKKYKQYCVAIHKWTINKYELMKQLYGTTLTYITNDNNEVVLCKL
jgi:hypothetical protein